MTSITTAETVLSTDKLTRCYGKLTAVNEVSIHIPKGLIYGFLGMNGAGKSTLINMLMGKFSPTSGAITLQGETVKVVRPDMRKKIGFVSQEQHFYPWMRVLALGDFVSNFYPNWDQKEFLRLIEVLEIPTDRKIKQLSGGNKTKLALTLALAINPEILILDEPTTGLDPVARREFMEAIVAQARNHNRTTFFSSHLVNEVEQCADVIGIIHNGKLRYEGMLADLKDTTREIIFDGPPPLDFLESAKIWVDETIESGRRLIIQASTQKWSELDADLNFEFTSKFLDLEDIFLACAKGNVAAV